MKFHNTNIINLGAAMVVGVCKIILSLDEAFSLKDKRQIIKSIEGRLKSRFGISVAEVGLNDKWKNAAIGVACVSNESSHADSVLENVKNFVEGDGRVTVLDYYIEILHFE